jgi:hypothetical protein
MTINANGYSYPDDTDPATIELDAIEIEREENLLSELEPIAIALSARFTAREIMICMSRALHNADQFDGAIESRIETAIDALLA